MVNFIVCEFNPFHNGHAYLLEQVHKNPNICIMSSHVTQRGDIAFTDKWSRAEMALKGGADLVLELSAPFAMGNAEVFAKGAAAIARATGLKGRFCFGTEGDVIEKLQTLAKVDNALLSPTVKSLQKQGCSYAVALTAAYEQILPVAKEVLSTPNNVLALEYMRAAKDFEFYGVCRKGAAHDDVKTSGVFCSASALRDKPKMYQDFTPSALHPIFEKIFEENMVPDAGKKDLLWLHTLRSLSAELWDTVAPGGVGHRFYKEVHSAATLDDLLSRVKTKCCTHASLRRLAMKAFLGIPPTDAPQYIRVLGANKVGRELLSKMNPTLPLLIKPAAVKELSSTAKALMEYESRLTDHFMFMLPTPGCKGKEFLTSPIIIE